MSYTALYRKWRPTSFEEVRGQDHIVKTLKNQINSGRIGHAYLFCGTRGTGKTSIAKIFARAVNCEHPVDGSPCGECSMCRQIAEGASLNVVEIDAASNNGVENIRDIREQVQYPPTDGRYRVYIIDEVHMLSIGAFNALLKTLEEPPSYVIFILATTEVHKIPITILSRCQRYDFKRISIDTIAGRLAELTQAEQIDVDDRALRYVARAAAGALDAQFARREDGDRLVDTALEPGFEQDGAFEDHVATLLPRRPGIEITHNDRMHQCIEVSQRLRVGKDDAREVSPVELPVAESPLAEATGKLPPQRPILLHQPFGRSVRIVNRNALLCKKAADSALAAADAARNSYFHHSCPSGKSISGTASIEVILISLNFTEIAFCNDCGSMMIRPSCPSSRERLYLSAESGMRSVLFM